MEISHTTFFVALLLLFIVERLMELRSAKRNTKGLLERGGKEFGPEHYKWILGLHTLFFISLVCEFTLRSAPLAPYWGIPFSALVLGQLLRLWVTVTMGPRWTSRILVIPGEKLIASGPFRFLAHPNYLAVVFELFSLPLIFGLFYTSIVFTILNGIMLLYIRIPAERAALEWSQLPLPE